MEGEKITHSDQNVEYSWWRLIVGIFRQSTVEAAIHGHIDLSHHAKHWHSHSELLGAIVPLTRFRLIDFSNAVNTNILGNGTERLRMTESGLKKKQFCAIKA